MSASRIAFDIGANVGRWAKAHVSRYDAIVCVEASPKTFQTLQKNVQPFPSIYPLQCDSPDPEVEFYECDAETISTLKSKFYNHAAFHPIRVPTISIDVLIQQFGVPELLKVDEYARLRSLTQPVPFLCFEWASEFKEDTLHCVDHLVSLGFTRFHLQMGDAYTFFPNTFEHTAESLKEVLQRTEKKKDWGMVWATSTSYDAIVFLFYCTLYNLYKYKK